MVKGGVVPAGGFMTQIALLAVRARVFIILGVTGITFHRRSLLRIGCVTGFAWHIGVLALQLERGQVVIERGGSPRVHGVTF